MTPIIVALPHGERPGVTSTASDVSSAGVAVLLEDATHAVDVVCTSGAPLLTPLVAEQAMDNNTSRANSFDETPEFETKEDSNESNFRQAQVNAAPGRPIPVVTRTTRALPWPLW